MPSLHHGPVLYPRALACVAACALAWLVAMPSDVARGASTGTTIVGAEVLVSTTIGTGGCLPGVAGTTSFGSITTGSSVFGTGDCHVTWGSNAATSMLRAYQTDGTGDALVAGAQAVPDYDLSDNDWDEGSGAFGACLQAVGASTTAAWTLDGSCTQVDGTQWNPITPTVVPASRIAAADEDDGEVRLRFGIRAGATQRSGAYSAGITFEVVAPDPGPGGVAPVAGTAGVSGTIAIGQTLTATNAGWNMGTPAGTFAYQWMRCGTSGGTCIDIAGQTGSTYVITATDGGRTIRVRLTASNAWGSASATSTQTTIVADTIGLESTSSTTSGGLNVTTMTPVVPGSVFEGDLLIAQIAVRDGTDITFDQVPAGWTLIRRTNYTNRIAMATYWKIATTTEPAAYTWGWTSPARRATGAIQSFSAVDPVTPIATSSGASGDSALATAPSVTVTAASSNLLAFFSTRDEINFADPNVPAMTQLWELTNAGNEVSSFALHQVRNAGATGTRSATIPGTSEWAAQLVVVNPRP
jgi:hypothetical protein